MEHMPDGSMRMIDKWPKFPGYLLTYSQTAMTIDYCYRNLLKLSFHIMEIVMERHLDRGFHLHTFLAMRNGRSKRLTPESVTIGGEKLNVVGKGKKKLLTRICI